MQIAERLQDRPVLAHQRGHSRSHLDVCCLHHRNVLRRLVDGRDGDNVSITKLDLDHFLGRLGLPDR